MKFVLTTNRVGYVTDLKDRDDLTLLTDSQDVQHIKEYLGNHADIEDFDGFFVCMKEGDYVEIYGFIGIIPYLVKPVWEIEWWLE